MAGINVKKVVIAGLAAGLVMNIIDFLANGVLLAAQWTAAMKALGIPDMTQNPSAVVVFLAGDFVIGLLIAFIYAAIRPRFGAGPRTGFIAGAIVWIVVLMLYWSFQASGIFSASLVMATMAASVVSVLAGGYVAGWLYSE